MLVDAKVLPVYISIVFSQVEHEEFFGLTYFTHGRTLNVPGAVLFKSPVVLPTLVTTNKCCLGGSSDVLETSTKR